MFFEDWIYYGFLTILVQSILYLSYRLILIEIESYTKKKFLKNNPEIAELLTTAEEDLVNAAEESMNSIPLISYLVYPEDLCINSANTLVVTTLERARDMADDDDSIMQIMFYPPNEKEQRYHSSSRAKYERAKILHKLFIENAEEDSDELPSTE